MTQQHGRRFEHTLTTELDDVTPDEVWATTSGYSGNAGVDACDVVVTVDPRLLLRGEPIQYNIEAKKRQVKSGRRASSVFGGGKSNETGLDELERLVLSTPRWAEAVVAVKFDRRKLVVVSAESLLAAVGERKQPMDNPTVLELCDPSLTPSDNVSMRKPTTEDWVSATVAPSDGTVLATELDLPTIDSVATDENDT